MNQMDTPFSSEQLARRWGVSAQHIRDLIYKGDLPCFRVGRLIRISAEAVREFECQISEPKSIATGGMQSGQMKTEKQYAAPSAPKIVMRPNVA